jgi:hypothetical protein
MPTPLSTVLSNYGHILLNDGTDGKSQCKKHDNRMMHGNITNEKNGNKITTTCFYFTTFLLFNLITRYDVVLTRCM